jgi:beta-lactamase regulating signal transducer with metallopeptidase domain
LYVLYVLVRKTIAKRISANTDHWILFFFLLAGATWFVTGILNKQAGAVPPTGTVLPLPLLPVMYGLSVIYLLLFLLRLMRLAGFLLVPPKQKTSAAFVPGNDLLQFLQEFCQWHRMRQPLLIFTGTLHSPFVKGWLKQVICIPASLAAGFTPQELEAVILHELAHIKRYDHWINIVVICCEQLLFFNPFARLLLDRLRQQREQACDDWVLQRQVQPLHYALALQKTARAQQQQASQWHLAMSNGRELLFPRIERLFHKDKNRHPVVFRFKPFAWLPLAFLLMAGARYALPEQAATQTTEPVPLANNPAITTDKIPSGNRAPFNEIKNNAPIINRLPALAKKETGKSTAQNYRRNQAKPVAGRPVNILEEVVLVSNTTPSAPLFTYVSNGSRRNEDVVLKFGDSLLVYEKYIKRENVEDITREQLTSALSLISLLNEELLASPENLQLYIPALNVQVTMDGAPNFFFRNIKVVQEAVYDMDEQQWRLRFGIVHNDQVIGERFVTIYRKYRLQSTNL